MMPLALVVPTAALWAAVGVLALTATGLAVAFRIRGRRAAEAVERAGERCHALVDGAGDLILVHDRRGGAVELNAAARARLAVAETPATLRDLAVPEERDRLDDHLAALAEGGAGRTELHLASATGGVWVELDSRVVAFGDGERVVSVGREVGARRDREATLRDQRDEARAAVRDKSALLDSMSHNLRTPLTSVLGFAELLRDEVGPESRGLVEAIESGGRQLLSTLGSVLDLARLDAGREELRPAPLDVVARVRRLVAGHAPTAAEREIGLAVEADAESAWAVLDASVLDRVLGTLVGNAVELTEQGGVTVEVTADADTVTLRVIDTGMGVPADVVPEMFSEHRLQPGGPGQDDIGGTALGLAVVKRLVDLAGGTVSAESQWGAGTAITVALPRGASAPPPEAPVDSRRAEPTPVA